MSIWDIPTIRAVSHLRIEGWVAYRAKRAAVNVQNREIERVCSMFVEEAHTLAVEVNKNDLKVDVWKEDQRSAMHYRAYWEPATRTVELRGGPKDGTLMEVRDTHTPLYVANDLGVIYWEAMEPSSPVNWETLTYMMAGWSEEKRHWVFDLAL